MDTLIIETFALICSYNFIRYFESDPNPNPDPDPNPNPDRDRQVQELVTKHNKLVRKIDKIEKKVKGNSEVLFAISNITSKVKTE